MARTGALLLAALALAGCAQACIYKFGTSPDSKVRTSEAACLAMIKCELERGCCFGPWLPFGINVNVSPRLRH